MKEKVIISWSGGKDSALSLYKVIHDDTLEPVGLLTTLTEGYDRVSLHGVRRSLVERQASALGMALHKVFIPKDCSNKDYEKIMREVISGYKNEEIKGFVFGDIFLEDVRKYREERLLSEGFKAYFPLWGKNTENLVHQFIKLGFKTVTCCVDGDVLNPSYVGRNLDEKFLDDLPSSVDPAGENGEYHSFVYDGPIFSEPIPIKIGRTVKRDLQGKTFYYCDLQIK